MTQKKKEKNVGSFFEEVKPHFTRDILDAPLPPKVKIPQIMLHEEEWDPGEHLETSRSWIELQWAIGVAMCRTFLLTLTGSTCNWYRKPNPELTALFD